MRVSNAVPSERPHVPRVHIATMILIEIVELVIHTDLRGESHGNCEIDITEARTWVGHETLKIAHIRKIQNVFVTGRKSEFQRAVSLCFVRV